MSLCDFATRRQRRIDFSKFLIKYDTVRFGSRIGDKSLSVLLNERVVVCVEGSEEDVNGGGCDYRISLKSVLAVVPPANRGTERWGALFENARDPWLWVHPKQTKPQIQ